MISRGFGEEFAREWIEAWNSHDLDRVLSHYADDFTMSSPYIAQICPRCIRHANWQGLSGCWPLQSTHAGNRRLVE
jgi:ketosteroid isomerase-like protein